MLQSNAPIAGVVDQLQAQVHVSPAHWHNTAPNRIFEGPGCRDGLTSPSHRSRNPRLWRSSRQYAATECSSCSSACPSAMPPAPPAPPATCTQAPAPARGRAWAGGARRAGAWDGRPPPGQFSRVTRTQQAGPGGGAQAMAAGQGSGRGREGRGVCRRSVAARRAWRGRPSLGAGLGRPAGLLWAGGPSRPGAGDGQLSWNTRRGVNDWTQARLVTGARVVQPSGRPAGRGARGGPNPPDSRWEQLRPFVLGLVPVCSFALRGTFSLTPRSARRPRGRERAMEGPGSGDEPGEARPAVSAPVVPLRVRLGFLQLWRALAARLAGWAWWLTAHTRPLGGLPRLPRHLPPSLSWLKDSEARGLVGLAPSEGSQPLRKN